MWLIIVCVLLELLSLALSKPAHKIFTVRDFTYEIEVVVWIEFVVVIGEAAPVDGEDQLMSRSSKTEISLTLTNKFEVPEDDDSDMRALFVRSVSLM